MNYRTQVSMQVIGELKEMDRQTAAIILRWVTKYIEDVEDPRRRGSAVARGVGRWQYEIGLYRLLVEIQDDRETVLLLWLGKISER